MKKYEYMVEDSFSFPIFLDSEKLESWLNELGEQGWELVQLDEVTGKDRVVLKRIKE